MAASILYLVPGVPLSNGTADLLTGYYFKRTGPPDDEHGGLRRGLDRLAGAFEPLGCVVTWTIVFAAPAAVGFAVLFNVRRRALIPIVVLAVIAKGLAVLLVGQDMSVVFELFFLAALLVGVVAYTLDLPPARPRRSMGSPPSCLSIPGVYVFQALQALESVVIARSGGVQALNPSSKPPRMRSLRLASSCAGHRCHQPSSAPARDADPGGLNYASGVLAEDVVAGLRGLFGGDPDLQIPDDAGQPWLTVKYGDDPGDLYGVLR